ncbi:probable LRR receptor-like serine/threonine-protein kinase At3g47570 [Magnolia sinica]|uniref:probable LRR receptor-like serine/threonine-protein kinase At3g47570 n=1 Tax=Magnolia sinica TaxID=86752 RepID=UPI0026591129|nr:probable LRR receptor-like serine/threonine-protein kinase At3g47570 [Magnolia sinica]
MELPNISLRAFWSFLLISSIHVPCFFVSAAHFSHETDRLFLLHLKHMITDDPLHSMSSWNDTLHFCHWQGVTCGRRHLDRVTALNLTDQNLEKNNTPFIGNLTFLKIIDLSSNSLEGSIPNSFGQLVRLRWFLLSQNALSGTIPPQLYNISSIKALDVGENRLHGNLPPNLGLTLPNLQILRVVANQFTGPIPVSLSNSSGLLLIDLGYNSFTGSVPLNFGSLESLSRLFLSRNQLGIGKAHDLNFLYYLTNCSELQELDVSNNILSGVLPESLANLSTQLNFLSLGSNKIFGSIPSGIQNLVGLTLMDMVYNFLRGPIPMGVGKPNNLTRSNDLTLVEMICQGQFHLLWFIHLNNNNLSGTLPRSLFRIPSLIELRVESNSFTGDLPFEVSYSNALGRFSVSNNKLSGEIPSRLGSIPPTFTTLKGLRLLDLSRNNLSGKIPRYLEKFALEYLNLSFNNFEGELPKRGVFGNISRVSVLGNSKLCGGIPGLQLRPCPSQASKKKGKSLALKVKLSIIVVLCLLSITSFFTTLYWVRKARRIPSAEASVEIKLRRKPLAVPSVEIKLTRKFI